MACSAPAPRPGTDLRSRAPKVVPAAVFRAPPVYCPALRCGMRRQDGGNAMDFFINTAHAQAAGAGGGQGIMSAMMLPLVLLVVFYFLLIRPQNKRAKEQREMLSKIAQ